MAVALAVVRVASLWIAILHRPATIIALIVAAAIYFVEIVLTYVRKALQKSKRGFSVSDTALFYGAHISVINFALDRCSARINTMTLQHIVIIVINVSVIFIIYIGLDLVDPIQRAWMCYPKHHHTPKLLNRGMCPQWENFYGEVSYRSSSNSGNENLICRDEAITKVPNRACITGEIQASLPVFWHIASMLLTVSFTFSLTMVRYKIKEIQYLGL